MSQMLLLNPRKRRKARKAAPKRRRNPAARAVARRSPMAAMRRRVRRSNPIRRVIRRKRNPINLGGAASGMLAQFKTALIGGAGAVAVDAAMGQINKFLPATMVATPGTISVGTGVKAVITAFLGKALSKASGGLSVKMAQGALTVQMADVIRGFVPSGVALGYMSPSPVASGSQRVGPMRRAGVGMYTRPGVTPMLSAYTQPGVSPLLSRVTSARDRENSVR